MSKRVCGFTLIELLVVISIIALLIGILLPAIGAARRASQQMQNSSQVRGIHTSMVIYAQGNEGWFPGRLPSGEAPTKQVVPGIPGESGVTNIAQTGLFVQSRYRELLEDRYFSGEFALAPTDRRVSWTSGNVLLEHYSYAMLAMNDSSGPSGNRKTRPPNLRTPNASEWHETANAEAVVLGDRAIGNSALGEAAAQSMGNEPLYRIRSIWTTPLIESTDWRGSVGWNDGHATFEKKPVVRTRMGTSRTENDFLFNTSTGTTLGGPGSGVSNGDVMLVWHHYAAIANMSLHAPTVRWPFGYDPGSDNPTGWHPTNRELVNPPARDY